MNSKWPMWGWTLWKQTTKIRYLLSSLFHLLVPWIQFIRGNEIHIVSLELDPAATSLPPPNLGWFFFFPFFPFFLFFSFPDFLFQPLQKGSCLMLSAPLEIRLPFKAYHIKACYWLKLFFKKKFRKLEVFKKSLYISEKKKKKLIHTELVHLCTGSRICCANNPCACREREREKLLKLSTWRKSCRHKNC